MWPYVSILLNLAVIILIFFMRQRIQNEQKQIEQIKNEIEHMLRTYTADMKKENERLIRELETKTKHEIEKFKVEQTDEKALNYDPIHVATANEGESYVQSMPARVLALGEKGWTAEQIAKKLQIGVGEVQLMLKVRD